VIASRTPNPLCHQAASKLHLPRINLRWVRSFVEQLHLQQALAKTCMHTGSAASHSAPTTSSDDNKRSHMQCRLAEPDQPCRCRFSVQRCMVHRGRAGEKRPPARVRVRPPTKLSVHATQSAAPSCGGASISSDAGTTRQNSLGRDQGQTDRVTIPANPNTNP